MAATIENHKQFLHISQTNNSDAPL